MTTHKQNLYFSNNIKRTKLKIEIEKRFMFIRIHFNFPPPSSHASAWFVIISNVVRFNTTAIICMCKIMMKWKPWWKFLFLNTKKNPEKIVFITKRKLQFKSFHFIWHQYLYINRELFIRCAFFICCIIYVMLFNVKNFLKLFHFNIFFLIIYARFNCLFYNLIERKKEATFQNKNA